EQGQPVRIVGTVQDVTERKQVEEALAQYVALIFGSEDAIMTMALNGTILSWNPGAERLYGYVAEEIEGHPVSVLFPLDRYDEWRAVMDRVGRGDHLDHLETEPLRHPLRRKTDQMAGLIDQMVDKVRTLATELRPAVLDSLGLSAAIDWAGRQFAERTGIECTLDLPPHPVRIDSERSTDVFRILQEALTNVVRHARATRVDVHLRATPEELVLEVHDNGRGISDREVDDPRAFGLVGMRERVLPWGGEVGVHAAPQGGTSVTVCIPRGHGRPGTA